MNSKRLFLLATKLEAKALLNDSSIRWKADDQENELYSADSGDALLITGIGPTRTAFAIGKVAKTFQDFHWINLGVVGALQKDLQVGEIGWVSKSISGYEKHPFDRSMDEVHSKHEGWRCITLGEALHDEEKKGVLSDQGDIVDMELHAIAMCAKLNESKLESNKIISDFSSEKDQSLIVKRIPELMANLWQNWKGHNP